MIPYNFCVGEIGSAIFIFPQSILPSPPFASSDPITLCGWSSSSSVEEREGRRVPIFKLPIDQIAAAYKWIRRPPPETGCRRKERIKEEGRNQKPNCKTLPNGLTNGWKGSHEWRAGQNERFWIQLWYWVKHTGHKSGNGWGKERERVYMMWEYFLQMETLLVNVKLIHLVMHCRAGDDRKLHMKWLKHLLPPPSLSSNRN